MDEEIREGGFRKVVGITVTSAMPGPEIVPDTVIVRFGEITLKDRWTRSAWERILQANISRSLRDAGVDHKISRDGGRIFIHTSDPSASQIAASVFGVVSASPARSIDPDPGEICRASVDLALSRAPTSFAIRPRRSGGPISSESIAVSAGRAVQEATGSRVDLSSPELEIFIEARRDRALVYEKVVKGVGGLPLGSQSRMLGLISGGIDSPVAAWMMMRRGCPVSLLHFDARPYADSRVQAIGSAQVLRRWTSGRMINFVTVKNARGIDAIASRQPRATCILCRRLMYHIASEVMRREGALGIVTGYSLGQVASQTPENIMAEQARIDAPIYHPLIAMDKTEITDLARRIGTYEVTEETKSCTAVPKKPMTKAKLEDILALDEEIGLQDLASELAENSTIERI